MPIVQKRSKNLGVPRRVSGLCQIYLMNEEIKTQVFCSQCDFVTSNFIEWGGEFYCEEECVAFLPTEGDFDDDLYADHEALVSVGWGDDEDYF